MAALQNCDIVVIGASTGGVSALRRLFATLPVTLPASVFVVLHEDASTKSSLPAILRSAGPLPAAHALHGEAIEVGRVYVAPPDDHLLVRPGHVHVVRGPHENGHRPAVNALFRTAAAAYGPRVIGVVLTGAGDCGTVGLAGIKAQGGIAVVQDPLTALCPDMPASAVRHIAVDRVVDLEHIGPVLIELTARAAGPTPPPPAQPPDVRSVFTCPECHGSLTETGAGALTEFRCHVGHTYTLRGMHAGQAEQLEAALWAAIRALEESEVLARRLLDTSSGRLRVRFDDKAAAMKQHADVIRRIVINGQLLAASDAHGGPEND